MQVGLDRDTKDAFYTKPQVALDCIAKLREVLDIDKYDVIMEPSAGSGSFSNYFNNNGYNTLAYDIDPKEDYILQQDFLELEDEFLSGQKVLVIGNPPFGRQSTLAKKFIKKCSKFSKVIAFILPKSFKKQSFQSVFPPKFHLVYEYALPNDAFTVDDVSHHVPCVFQIWKRKKTYRHVDAWEEPRRFKYVKIDEDPDYALRRVGVYAGRIHDIVDDKSQQSHYFIKLNDDVDKEWFLERFNRIVFETDNTVGPKSISKKEFTKAINEVLI